MFALRTTLYRYSNNQATRCCSVRVIRMVHRKYMDVHTRPSHSGMFQRGGERGVGSHKNNNHGNHNNHIEPPPTPSSPQSPSEWQLYKTLAMRAALAVGMVYCITEYIADITLCEGPSMVPTLRSSGEIVLIDKFFVFSAGMQYGCKGQERTNKAMERQAEFEKKNSDNKNKNSNTEWHERRIPVNQIKKYSWRKAWKHLVSPLSVGDVVVVQHPNRKGTVCKRVLGLPGDQVLQNRGGLLVVPDAHMWLEGDNPANSADSRNYGCVPAALLVGRVVCRIWPLRGDAWMKRGAPPEHSNVISKALAGTGSTVLPAGYEGQHIVKRTKQ